jgi:predicted metal-dependent HD superfamily phosphohydrolase
MRPSDRTRRGHDSTHQPTLERWAAVCAACGVRAEAGVYRAVLRSWRSWGRHYHTLAHLQACLQEFERVRALAKQADEVELALWFHDAVYRSWRSDNEARSAQWAVRVMRAGGAAADRVERVSRCILATRHAEPGLQGDAALIVDIDLAILGREAGVYRVFEGAVRREYWWVPRRRYAAARCAILESFLRRASIYHFPVFRERYEARARMNLQATIAALSAGGRSVPPS